MHNISLIFISIPISDHNISVSVHKYIYPSFYNISSFVQNISSSLYSICLIFHFEVLSFSVHSPLFQFYLLVWQLKYCWYSYYKLPSLFHAYCSFPVFFQIFSLNQLFIAKHFQFFFGTFPRPTYIFTARDSSSEYYLSYTLYTSSYPASLILNSAVTNPASSPFV